MEGNARTSTVSPKTYTAEPENDRETFALSALVKVEEPPMKRSSWLEDHVSVYVNNGDMSSTVVFFKVALTSTTSSDFDPHRG